MIEEEKKWEREQRKEERREKEIKAVEQELYMCHFTKPPVRLFTFTLPYL